MVNFKDGENTVQEAFNLNTIDLELFHDFMSRMNEKSTTVTKIVSRIWVDERMSDNLKCYLIFTLGRCYEHL